MAVDPKDQEKINNQIKELAELYRTVDRISAQQAQNLAEAQAKAGNLNNEISRLKKNLDDLVFNSDYLYRSFQETTAELRNQNILLKLGTSAFNDLTKQAQKLTNFQQGYSDLQEKDFKKIKESYQIQKKEIDYIVDSLSKNEEFRKNEIQRLNSIAEAGGRITKTEKERLNTLLKEQGLLEASRDAQNGGLKLLEKELDLSKQIFKTRRDLGGLANAAASVFSKFGGGLAQYLDITEATEAVNEFNQKLIDDALKQKDVVAAIQEIEDQKVAMQQEILDSAREVREIELQISLAKEAQIELDKLRNEELQKSNELTSIGLQTTRLINELNASANDQSTEALQRRTEILNALNTLSNRESEILTEQEDIATKIADAKTRALNTTDLSEKAEAKKIELANKEATLNERIAAKEQEAYDIKQKAIAATSTGLTGFINKFKSLGVLINNSFGGLKKLFTDPVVLITTLVELGFKANTQAVELGKSLGISANEAEGLRSEMAEFARNTGDSFVNTDRLLKAQSELSKELGIAVKFSNEELVTFSKLTELTGLSAQEAGKLAQASAAAGVPTQDYTDSIREAAFYAQQATGTHFDSKEILQDVAKLSAGILVKFQGNPKAIGQAVVEAKKLGLTLEQIDKVGESLLNWESSIENELKAELMTGKQLNLERARAAALSGDQLTLTQEISSQVGTLNDFQNMNVLAQKSLADAFGLSRDEMAEMLMKQEAINKYGAEAADLNKEQLQALKDSGLSAKEFLAKQEQQRTAQAKFQDALVKLQTIFANLVDGPVGKLLDALADIAGVAMNILKIFEPLFKVISFVTEQIGIFASTDLGKVVLGIGAFALFLPKIASGLGFAAKGVLGLGQGILSVFNKETWSKWGKGLESVFSKDKFTGFFSSLKDKFLEAGGWKEKLKEGVTDKAKEVAEGAAETVTEKGKESLTDTLKDKATETIEGKVEDKAGELKDKIMGGDDEAEVEYEEVEEGSDGSKFRDKMKNVAEGIKAFGDGKVILGGLIGLPASAVGLIAMLPGVLGIKAIERVNGEKFQTNMLGIASGIKAFGNVQVTGGAANLIISSLGLIAMIPGVLGAKLIELINGPKFTESMIGLSTGISAMGILTVTGGAANLIAASIGLIAMIPGVAGAKLIELINGPKFTESMIGLATGLTAMGSLTVTGGAANLIVSSLGLIAMIPGTLGALAIQTLINGPKITESLIGLAVGLSAMATPSAVLGALALIPASLGLTAMIPGVIGGALLGVAGPLIQAGLTSLAVGLTTFGTAAMNPMVWAGVGLLAAFNLALIPLGYTLNLMAPAIEAFGSVVSKVFSGIAEVITAAANGIVNIFGALQNVDVMKLLAIGPALVSISIGLAALGAGGVISAIGAFLGGDPIKKIEQLAASGDGLQKTSIALQTTSAAITQLNASLASLDVSKLFFIGPALMMIGEGLRSLSGGGIGDVLSSLFTGDPIEKLERLAATSDRLQVVSTAIQSIASALIGVSAALAAIDVSKLETLDEFASNRSSESVVGGVVDFITSPIKAIGETIGGEEQKKEKDNETTINAGGIDLTPMIKAINEVKASVDKLYGKNTAIYMDSKAVSKEMVNKSHKFA